jgi:hypothetical protein
VNDARYFVPPAVNHMACMPLLQKLKGLLFLLTLYCTEASVQSIRTLHAKALISDRLGIAVVGPETLHAAATLVSEEITSTVTLELLSQQKLKGTRHANNDLLTDIIIEKWCFERALKTVTTNHVLMQPSLYVRKHSEKASFYIYDSGIVQFLWRQNKLWLDCDFLQEMREFRTWSDICTTTTTYAFFTAADHMSVSEMDAFFQQLHIGDEVILAANRNLLPALRQHNMRALFMCDLADPLIHQNLLFINDVSERRILFHIIKAG